MVRIVELKTSAKIWKELMEMTLWNELKLVLDKDGISHKEVDPAHVAYFQMKIDKTLFTEYHIRKPIEIGLDVDVIKDRLKKAKASDMVTLYYTQNYEMRMLIEKPYGTIHKGFFPIDTAGLPDTKLPHLNLTDIKVNREHFIDAVENIGEISDHIHLTLEGNKLEIKAKENTVISNKPREEKEKQFINEVKLNIERIIKSKTGHKSLFSTDYVEMMLKFANYANSDLLIGIGTDNPMSVTFSRERDGKKLFEGMFLLAPRIESE